MIQFQCTCGKLLQARAEYAGLEIACPGCGARMAVPGAPHAIQPTAPLRPAPAVTSSWEEGEGRRPRQRQPRTEMSGKAIVSLVCGGLTLVLPVILAIPAILFAVLALADIKREQGRRTGKGLALAGLILGLVGNVTIWPYLLIYNGVKDSQARRDSLQNLRELTFAMHNYNDTFKTLPASAIYSKDGRPLLSWRVAILPFIEQQPLYQQFKMDEPWDSPHNIRLLEHMPKLYAPLRGSTPQPHSTYYQVFTGPKTPFNGSTPPRIPATFTDGTSNTFMIVEGAEAVPWTKPADVVMREGSPVPPLGATWGGGNNFCVSMADGSVRIVDRRRVSDQTLRLLIDPNDGQAIPGDWDF
jgi:hypothetical protein